MLVDTWLTSRGIKDLFGTEVRDALRRIPALVVYDQPTYFAILVTDTPAPARFRTFRIEASMVADWEKWTEVQLLPTKNRFQFVDGRNFLTTIANAGWLESTADERDFADLIRLMLLPDRLPEPARLHTL